MLRGHLLPPYSECLPRDIFDHEDVVSSSGSWIPPYREVLTTYIIWTDISFGYQEEREPLNTAKTLRRTSRLAKRLFSAIFMVCILLCYLRKYIIWNSRTTNNQKETKQTLLCQHSRNDAIQKLNSISVRLKMTKERVETCTNTTNNEQKQMLTQYCLFGFVLIIFCCDCPKLHLFISDYRFLKKLYPMSRSSDWHLCFVTGKSRIQASIRKPAVLIFIKVFYSTSWQVSDQATTAALQVSSNSVFTSHSMILEAMRSEALSEHIKSEYWEDSFVSLD
jgi:hypothetical protein